MSTYTQILYQIIFATKDHEKTLLDSGHDDLYKFIWGILKNKNCHPYIINAVQDHIHIVTHLHPTICLADLVKDIKLSSTKYIKDEKLFPNFKGWQNGYGAFTYSYSANDKLIAYVANQKEHHKLFCFREEYIALLKEHGVEFDEKYLL